MKPAMYLFANKGLKMSPGKMAAQVAHAAVMAYSASDAEMIRKWNRSGFTKLVMEARDTEHLLMIERYLNDHGFVTKLIIDEGRTEIDPHTPTALGVTVVDKDDERVQFAFADFRTFKTHKLRTPFRKATAVDLAKGNAVVIVGDPE